MRKGDAENGYWAEATSELDALGDKLGHIRRDVDAGDITIREAAEASSASDRRTVRSAHVTVNLWNICADQGVALSSSSCITT